MQPWPRHVELESIQNHVYEDQGEIVEKIKATGSGSGPPPLPPPRTEKLSAYQQQPQPVHVKENSYEIPQEINENPQAVYDANLPPAMSLVNIFFDSNDN